MGGTPLEGGDHHVPGYTSSRAAPVRDLIADILLKIGETEAGALLRSGAQAVAFLGLSVMIAYLKPIIITIIIITIVSITRRQDV